MYCFQNQLKEAKESGSDEDGTPTKTTPTKQKTTMAGQHSPGKAGASPSAQRKEGPAKVGSALLIKASVCIEPWLIMI